MIYNHPFNDGNVALLMCDECGRELYDHSIETAMVALCADLGLGLGLGQEATPTQRTTLRRVAQDTHCEPIRFDAGGRSYRDLCPDCRGSPSRHTSDQSLATDRKGDIAAYAMSPFSKGNFHVQF